MVGNIQIKGNEFFSPKIKYVLNIADNLGYTKHWYADISGSFFDSAKLLVSIAILTPFSKTRRQAMKAWMQDILKLSQQGAIQTIFREVQEQDLQT